MKLIYDIKAAKVGDKCFDARLGKCEVTSIQIDKHGITLWLSGDRDKCQVQSSYPPDLEPLLFTSKEAFDLYWFEKTKKESAFMKKHIKAEIAVNKQFPDRCSNECEWYGDDGESEVCHLFRQGRFRYGYNPEKAELEYMKRCQDCIDTFGNPK